MSKKIKPSVVEQQKERIESTSSDQTKRLTPKEKMKVVACYVTNMSLKATAERFGLTPRAVRYIVDHEEKFAEMYQKQREKEAKELFGALSVKGKKFIKFCNIYFDLLADEDTIREFWKKDPEKVTKMFGVLVDKFVVLDKVRMSYGLNEDGDQEITVNIVRKEKED